MNQQGQYYPNYNKYNRISYPEQQRRTQLFQKLCELTQGYFAYLLYLTYPTTNYAKYPNSFIQAVIAQYEYGNVAGEWEYKKLFEEFSADYQTDYQRYATEEVYRYQEQVSLAMANMASQSQPIAYTPPNGDYSNYANYVQQEPQVYDNRGNYDGRRKDQNRGQNGQNGYNRGDRPDRQRREYRGQNEGYNNNYNNGYNNRYQNQSNQQYQQYYAEQESYFQPVQEDINPNIPAQLDQAGLVLSRASAVIAKDTEQFSTAKKLWNTIFTHISPNYIIQPATQQDVSRCIKFAKSKGITIAIRSGGHGFAALSTISDGIVLDMQKFKKIECNTKERWVQAQAGTKFGDVDKYLWEKAPGLCCLSGMDHSIGFAGAILGVGQGFKQREIGLGVDNIISLRVALADGSIVNANKNENPDLFWALRGNAGNIALVISIKVQLHTLNPKQDPETYVGAVFWPLTVAKQVFLELLDWTHEPTFPNSLFWNPVLKTKEGVKGLFLLSIHYPRDKISFAKEVQARILGMVKKHGGKVMMQWKMMTHLDTQLTVLNFPKETSWYNSGVFLDKNRQYETMCKLVDHFKAVPNDFSVIAFYQLGGVIHKRAVDETCFPSAANNEWDAVFFAAWPSQDKVASKCRSWVREGYQKILMPGATHGYANGTPFDRINPEIINFIYGKENVQRQMKIKSKYDPDNFFKHSFNVVKDRAQSRSIQFGVSTLCQTEFKPVVPAYIPVNRRFSIDQIKTLINNVNKQSIEAYVNPEILAKTREINSWQTKEEQVAQKDDFKMTRKDSKRPNDNPNFRMRERKNQAEIAKQLGYKPQKQDMVEIKFGIHQTLEARKYKQEIRKMAGKDFATLKASQYETMDILEKNRKQIIFNLNLIVPQNLKEVEKDLVEFLYEDIQVCKILISQIIKKAWDQPKYASTYAKLCENFAKKRGADFKFAGKTQQKQKKDNPFKYFLIESVQHSFDQKIEKFPEFESTEDKQLFLKQTKNKIMSNVKFIAELIIHKVLKKRTIKNCISQLFKSFLGHYYAFVHDKQIQDSTYDFHFEGIIQFIENIGEKFEEVQEKAKDKETLAAYDYNQIQGHINDIIKATSAPNYKILDQLQYFNGNDYFHILDAINNAFIRKNHPRLSALLQNLEQRRNNGWQKHLSVADGPKKLKEIQEDILHEERQNQGKQVSRDKERERHQQEKLDKDVKELFQGWQMDKHLEIKEMKDIVRKYANRKFYLSFLRQVADEKKDKVIKRVGLFEVVIAQKFKYNDFIDAWFDAIRVLAIGSGDYPYCGAAMAKILAVNVEKDGNLKDFYKKFDEQEEQDEVYFLQDILQKYYNYTQDEKALQYVKPKAKLSHLI